MSSDQKPRRVAIVYFTGSGRTAQMAQSIAEGAASISGVKAETFLIHGSDIVNGKYSNTDLIQSLTQADALIFGSPTYMGNVAAEFKAFADATVGLWSMQAWRDKIAGGFTVSGTPSGDKLTTLQFMQTFAMQHGMVWVGLGEPPLQPNGVNRLGSWSGAMAQTLGQAVPNLGEEDLLTAKRLGQRIAKWTLTAGDNTNG